MISFDPDKVCHHNHCAQRHKIYFVCPIQAHRGLDDKNRLNQSSGNTTNFLADCGAEKSRSIAVIAQSSNIKHPEPGTAADPGLCV